MHSDQIAVLSFYSFTNLPEPEMVMPRVLLIGKKKCVRGTILLAKEGFNGSLSGDEESCRFVINELAKIVEAKDVSIKVNYCDIHPFQKFKVKLKREIVALGAGDIDVEKMKGEYIDPADWDEFIARDDVILVDTRNDYEVSVGTFEKAVNPFTETFREFPDWVEKNKEIFDGKKIAMCCTGGIRCEKSTAFMKLLGYKDVYHLKGGILQYLEDTGNANGKWHGDCFVFDDRRAVDDGLAPASGHWLVRE
ncbi:MAG: hypothetical protein RLZZ59_579 [Pseudomonadota bacterium]|jgi:UPF0176 protein